MKVLQLFRKAGLIAAAALIFWGCKDDDPGFTPSATVLTGLYNQLTLTSVTLNGSYEPDPGATIEKTGFFYKQGEDGEWIEVNGNISASPFSGTAGGLDPHYEYKWYAYVKIAGRYVRGEEKRIIRAVSIPQPGHGSITSSSVLLSAYYALAATGNVTEAGFYHQKGNGAWESQTANITGGNSFSTTVEGLDANSAYNYYAYIKIEGFNEPFVSSTVSFSTL